MKRNHRGSDLTNLNKIVIIKVREIAHPQNIGNLPSFFLIFISFLFGYCRANVFVNTVIPVVFDIIICTRFENYSTSEEKKKKKSKLPTYKVSARFDSCFHFSFNYTVYY